MALMNASPKRFTAVSQWGCSILLLLITAISAQASIYYVATDGNDANPGSELQPLKTIKKGISAIKSGDTLYIKGGTYPEQINSNAQTLPTGSSWDDAPVISAYSGETVVLKPSGGSEVIALGHPSIKYLIFNGLVLDASNLQRSCPTGYGCSYGVGATNGVHHVRFTNIEIKNAAGSGVLITRGGSSIATSFEFIGCDVHNNGVEARDHGFYLATSGNRVKNCKVHHNAGFGIIVYTGNTSVTANNNTIDGNYVYDNATTSGSAPGILIDNGSGNLVMNNVVRGNKNGIHVGSAFVSGVSASSMRIYNNTIYQNLPGVGIDIFASSSQTDVKNNILYKNGGTILNKGINTVSSNNLFSDPRFVDELMGDFKLQQGSSAINQGILLGEVVHDRAGVARPQLGIHDIGAYEYSTTGGDTTPPSPPQNVRAQ